MAVTTFADISNLVPQIYERALFVAREQNLMAQLVDNKSAKGWMARVISERPKITAEEVADGEDYSNAQKFGKTPIATLTPGEVIAQVILTDRNIETDPDGARDDAATELGNAIAEKIDKDLAGLFASFTKDWLELGQPAANYAFLGDLANQAMRDYFVAGPLISATNDDAVGGIFTPKAIVLDTRRPPRLEAERDASARAWELNMTAGYAYGIQKQDYGVGYTSDASEP